MKLEIETRFAGNLERVGHLIVVYDGESAEGAPLAATDSDVLRAAVVFLHATLEDLLRSLLEWRLPLAAPSHLRDVPLAGKKARASFTLDEVAAFRGRSVDDLISMSVMDFLEKVNFSHPGEIEEVLERLDQPKALLDPYRDKLGPLMKRRHWIVHRADRDSASGIGPRATRALHRLDVEVWRDALRDFGMAVLAQL